MKKIRVLQIASGDLWAGAEVQFYNLCLRLQAFQCIQLRAVILNEGILADRLRKTGIDTLVLNEQVLSSLAILRRLSDIFSEYRPDVAHSHRLKENVLSGISSIFSLRTKCITTIHGAPETRFALSNAHKIIYKLVERFIIAFRFTAKVYVSHELRAKLERNTTANSRVIENGIEIEKTLNRAKARVSHSLDRRLKHIGFLGRLSPVKRPDMLLRVAELTVRRNKLPYVFHVIGDGPLFQEMKARVAEENLAENVILHGFNANPVPLLAEMDSLLITSDHEGLPTNLLEAMCLGVPVVAHAVGEIPRVLEYGKLGTLVKDQEPECYAGALEKSISMPRPDMNASAQFNRVREHYSADRNAGQYINLYYELLSLVNPRECPEF